MESDRTTAQHRLELMLRQLDKMDHLLQSERCPPPTVPEIRLFGLIKRHVELYIQLFQSEDLVVEEIQYRCKRLCQEASHQGTLHYSTLHSSFHVPMFNLADCDPTLLPTHIAGEEMHVAPSETDTISLPSALSCTSVCEAFEKTLTHYGNIQDLIEKCRSSLPQSERISALRSIMDAVNLADFASESCSGSKEPRGLEESDCGMDAEDTLGHELEPDAVVSSEMAHTMESDCAMDADQDERTEEGKEVRRRCLHDVLRELVELGRLRSYAPPTDGEVEYYRQIRKRMTSFLAHVTATPHLLSVKDPKVAGKKRWLGLLQEQISYDLSYYPKMRVLATAVDTLPGCLSLFQEALPRLALLCSQFYTDSWGDEELSDDATKGKGNLCSQATEELEARCYLMSETEKGEPAGSLHAVSSLENDYAVVKHLKQNREECLFAILQRLGRIRSSCSPTLLTIQEVRLLAQIQEHVLSSMWLFDTKKMDTMEQKLLHNNYRKKICASGRKSGMVNECLIAPCTGSGEIRSREDYLQEIVVLVEAIRSSYLDIPPTKKEIKLYYKLNKQVHDALLNTETRAHLRGCKRKASSCTREDDDTYIRNLVKSVYSWELKWLQKLDEEYGKMIRMIIPFASRGFDGATRLRCFSSDLQDDLCCTVMQEFEGHVSPSRHQKLKMLDGMLLMLEKARIISGDVGVTVFLANKSLDRFLNRKEYTKVLEEVLGVFQVLQRNGSIYGCL